MITIHKLDTTRYLQCSPATCTADPSDGSGCEACRTLLAAERLLGGTPAERRTRYADSDLHVLRQACACRRIGEIF